jgi:hypothetical protein
LIVEKLVGELITPFGQRLSRASVFVSALFWATGLFLFHLFPASFPRVCPSGGTDVCGLLATHPHQLIVTLVVLIALLVATAVLVFDRTARVAQTLSGTKWPVREPFTRFQANRRERAKQRCHKKKSGKPNPKSWIRLELYPHGSASEWDVDPGQAIAVPLEPTLLGNIFAATRQRLLAMSGLRLFSCWQSLLLLIPGDVRIRLATASGVVMARIQAVMWFALSTVWAIWLPGNWRVVWIGVCVVGAYVSYRAACLAAVEYCMLITAVVLDFRGLLYDATGFPRPKSTDEERELGGELSAFLDGSGPKYYHKFHWPQGQS